MVEQIETTASIVMVGRVNPLIFQPEWLRTNNIIGEKEAEDASKSIEVIHRDITVLNLTNMKLAVEPGRFSITALEEPIVRVKDFVIACFNLLSHTPVSAVGLNRTLTFKTDEQKWHNLGDKLAPKDAWGVLLGDISGPRQGGMRSLTMELSTRPDDCSGYIRVVVEPLNTGRPETKLSYNDHYILFSKDRLAPASEAVKLIDEKWDDSMTLSEAIFDSIIALGEQE